MRKLSEFLEKWQKKVKIIFVYLAEAHADDVWPLGYGVNSSKTIEERWANCKQFLSKPLISEHLGKYIDQIFLDTMDDDYNNLVGAWPESYVFTDKNGVALWRSTFDGKDIKELRDADRIFK